MEKKNNAETLIMDSALGGAAAATAKLAASPFERALLLRSVNVSLKRPGPSSISAMLAQSWREEGITSWWRGAGMNTARYVPVQAINFAMKDVMERTICQSDNNDFVGKRLALNMAAGGIGGTQIITITKINKNNNFIQGLWHL
jgi:hypothetical protein